jgi:hypothetical protein
MEIFLLLFRKPVMYDNPIMVRTKIPAEFRDYLAKIGRKGGRIGGAKRAANMTPEQRSEAARKAVQARWDREKEKKGLQ